MKYLTSQGIGVDKKRADPVTLEDEIKMWDTYFHCHLLLALVMQCFFTMVKLLPFEEWMGIGNVLLNNFKLEVTMRTIANLSNTHLESRKNVQGGLKHHRIEITPIIQYEDPTNPRCLVKLNETYLSLVPSKGPLYRSV